ncbi:transposase [Streptomyces sp. MST-110588]|uniref:transposase n=1 Tax=Streptomyces sp. MST-110588 TaxID=2833628 RepID=UPI002413E1C2|nr:transposase [Streptomyces sp. MST-110588]
MAHRVRRRGRPRRAARPGRGPHRRRRPGLAVHHTADLAKKDPPRCHRHVATYRAAIRTGLPDATVVVDHFHVVQLANKMLSMVRGHTTAEMRGRRGRASDPEWKARRRLLRNREGLTDEQFTTMWNPLPAEGKIGRTLLTARIAKESLCNLLVLARTGANRHRIGHARRKFLTWCAGADTPEARQLATRGPLVDRDRSIHRHRPHQRQERRDQPCEQARRPRRLRVPQRRQPTPAHTVRHHPPSPRAPPHRSTSKAWLVR